ncbi:MAG: L,D-transpeptidase [Candidatus Kapaibacteriota bacterium]
MKYSVYLIIFLLPLEMIFGEETLEFPQIKYKLLQFKNNKELIKFLKEFSPQKNKTKYRVLTTLNRKELRFFRINLPIIVPDSFVPDLRAYSVFPYHYEGARNIPKIIVVSNLYQAYACYEYGKLVRFAAVNTGKKSTPTYPGRYALQWKERLRRSSFNEDWIMPFTWNFHRLAGMAFHQFEMPGYPASHMCIRQFSEDAEWLYNWGEGPKKDSTGKIIPMSGTPVIIIDFYNFGGKKKWLELTSNQPVISLPPNPMEIELALIPIVHIPPELRVIIPKKERKRYETALDTLIARGILPKNIKLTPSQSLKKTNNDKKGSKTNTQTQSNLPFPAN